MRAGINRRKEIREGIGDGGPGGGITWEVSDHWTRPDSGRF